MHVHTIYLFYFLQEILPVEFALPNGQRVSMYVQDATVGTPMIAAGNVHASHLKVYPSEVTVCYYSALLNNCNRCDYCYTQS